MRKALLFVLLFNSFSFLIAAPFDLAVFLVVENKTGLQEKIPFEKINDSLFLCHSLLWFDDLEAIPITVEGNESVFLGEQNIALQKINVDFTKKVELDVIVNDSRMQRVVLRLYCPQNSGLPIFKMSTLKSEYTPTKKKREPIGLDLYDSFDLKNVRRFLIAANGIKGRGNSTWTPSKKPFALKLDTEESFFGLPSHKKWVLLANYYDKSLLRNEFAFKLGNVVYRNLLWTPSSQQVEFFLNGEYEGVYELVEDKKLGDGRIELGKSLASGDFLVEIDSRAEEDGELYFNSSSGFLFAVKSPKSQKAIEYCSGIINEFERRLFGSDFKSPTKGYASMIDMPSFVDWYLVNEIMRNKDAKNFSSIFVQYKKSTNCLYMGPLWDFDRCAGVDIEEENEEEGWYIKKGAWFNRLFQDEKFAIAVAERWFETKGELWFMIHSIQARGVQLAQAASNNFKRWDILSEELLPSAFVPGTYRGEVLALCNWLEVRFWWLDAEFTSFLKDAKDAQ